MSKTLASWQVENYTGGGVVAYVRYSFDQTFQDSDGLVHLRGNWKENYIEDTCTVAGTVATIPTHAAFPTTDDVPVNQQAGCTAVLLDANRRNPITLFSDWIIPANVGDPITHANLVDRNEARQELPDRSTYSASVIDAKFVTYGLASAPKATDAVEGKGKLYEAALSAIAPIFVGLNSLYIGSRRLMTSAQASAASVVQGTIGKLTDGAKGMVYRSSALVSLFNLGAYSLTDFGGVDDGSTDNTTAIQAWLDAVAAGGGRGKIVKSANGTGQFNFSGTINWPVTGKMTIEGDGSAQGANIKLHYTGSGIAIQLAGDAVYYSVFKNLTLETATGSTGTTGILLTGGSPKTTQITTFDGLTINGFETGIHVLAADVSFAWQCSYIKASRVTIADSKYPIRINSLNSDWHISDLVTLGGRADGFGIYVDRCASLLIDHAQLQGGVEGSGSACSTGTPNPLYGESAIHFENEHGNIQINNSQQEGFRKSMVVNHADIENAIDLYTCKLAAPIELNADTILNTHGCFLFDNTVTATTANTRITSIGDGISTLNTCLDAGTGIGGFDVSGGARLRKLGVNGFSLSEDTPASFGTKPNASDPTLAATPQMSLASTITDKVLLAIGQAVSGVLSNHFQIGRMSDGFLAFFGTQAIPNRGIKFNGPMKFVGTSAVSLSEATRSVADTVVTNASPNISSATAAFTAADIGKIILLSGGSTVPNGTWVKSVTSSTAAVLSGNVTTTGASRALAIYGNAVLSYDPVANLVQISKNGVAFQNPQTSDDVYAAGAIPKQLSSSEQAASLLLETGGNITQSSGNFVLEHATGQLIISASIGTPPLVITSTDKVLNLNVDLLDGKDWTAPGTIGSVTPTTGVFTTIGGTVITGSVSVGAPLLKLSSAAAPVSPAAGELWNDSTQKGLQGFLAGIKQVLVGVIFTSTASATVANSVAETSIIGTGVGTLTLPANFFVVGKTIRVRVRGIMSITGTPNITVKVKLGSTVIVSTGVVAAAGTVANNLFDVVVDIICRSVGASGTVMGTGGFTYQKSTLVPATLGMVATAAVVVDTTASQVVGATVEFGTADAGNTISGQVTSVEVLN